MGNYTWNSYTEAECVAANFGRGLRELGQAPGQNIAIFAETRAEWMFAAQGCLKHSVPIVTVCTTLGDNGIGHCTSITETGVTTGTARKMHQYWQAQQIWASADDPQAHIFELIAECVSRMMGVSIGYSTLPTLIDASSKINRDCQGDANVATLQPICITTMPLSESPG
ncbi:GH24628 [Drosophila grimshawi]|uniref:long-chain-fatty-acid--CoA ligase n=1 Tax=Drosophila grimshawi TaxID=7222 RepID=B4JMH4_DROGR|nr:GH24628 [Drosophila grimshawi]